MTEKMIFFSFQSISILLPYIQIWIAILHPVSTKLNSNSESELCFVRIKVLDVSPEKKHTTTPIDYSKATEHCFVDIQ